MLTKENKLTQLIAFAVIASTFILTFNACKKNEDTNIPKTFTDPRDGQVYGIVKIGEQWWFAENLNYAIGNSWCYGNNPSNCANYGRLYDWETAKTACPQGWHLPSDAEWTQLTNFLGGESVAGGKMKSIAKWNAPNTAATNSSSFSGLPSGSRSYDGRFNGIGLYSYWWSSTERDTDIAWGPGLYFENGSVYRFFYAKMTGFSCRCLKD